MTDCWLAYSLWLIATIMLYAISDQPYAIFGHVRSAYALWLDVAPDSALESSLLHAQPNLDRR